VLEYQKDLHYQRHSYDPWKALANAVVETTADDYRRNMSRLLNHGFHMSDVELVAVRSHITECRVFFESDWGYLLSRGLAPVIWEKLQAEFAERLAWFNLRYPYFVKHRAKLERRRKKAEARYRKNLQRRKRQKARKKREAAAKTTTSEKNKMEVKIEWAQDI